MNSPGQRPSAVGLSQKLTRPCLVTETWLARMEIPVCCGRATARRCRRASCSSSYYPIRPHRIRTSWWACAITVARQRMRRRSSARSVCTGLVAEINSLEFEREAPSSGTRLLINICCIEGQLATLVASSDGSEEGDDGAVLDPTSSNWCRHSAACLSCRRPS